jgi:hypothetical protein
MLGRTRSCTHLQLTLRSPSVTLQRPQPTPISDNQTRSTRSSTSISNSTLPLGRQFVHLPTPTITMTQSQPTSTTRLQLHMVLTLPSVRIISRGKGHTSRGATLRPRSPIGATSLLCSPTPPPPLLPPRPLRTRPYTSTCLPRGRAQLPWRTRQQGRTSLAPVLQPPALLLLQRPELAERTP